MWHIFSDLFLWNYPRLSHNSKGYTWIKPFGFSSYCHLSDILWNDSRGVQSLNKYWQKYILQIVNVTVTTVVHSETTTKTAVKWPLFQDNLGKTSQDLNEATDKGVLRCRGNCWTMCKQSARHIRQITTPTPHHAIFTNRMLFLMPNQQCQSTEGAQRPVRIHTKSYEHN